MLPGTIIMLIVIVVGFFGGTAMLVRRNLRNEQNETHDEKSKQ